jgi:hypothetical protein
MQQQKTYVTADKLQDMCENLPNILSTIYIEDRLRLKDNVDDEIAVLHAFEKKKQDNQYYQMIEKLRKK